MTLERFVKQSVPEHLCFTCKFARKCPRYKFIVQTLQQVESEAVEKWRMNLTTTVKIDECDLYKMDFDAAEQFAAIQEYLNDDDDELEDEEGEV